MVECDLPKVDAAGSSPVVRCFFSSFLPLTRICTQNKFATSAVYCSVCSANRQHSGSLWLILRQDCRCESRRPLQKGQRFFLLPFLVLMPGTRDLFGVERPVSRVRSVFVLCIRHNQNNS